MKYIKITFADNEFEQAFPELAARTDLNDSDKIRVALGLEPRKASAGAPKHNKNAVGNPGRWKKVEEIARIK
jgi:hypothetical protein